MVHPTILVVEDERDLADFYQAWLLDEYEVLTAYTFESAHEQLSEEIDIALLDHRLPDGSGDQLLDAIHARGIDCQVAMVTAVDSDFDIIEMGFDDYPTKPITDRDIHEVVDR